MKIGALVLFGLRHQALLGKGKNCVGLWLGYGWYFPGYPGVRHSRPLARVQLEFETGGKPSRVVTDGSWKSRPSSYRCLATGHNEYGGTGADARQTCRIGATRTLMRRNGRRRWSFQIFRGE